MLRRWPAILFALWFAALGAGAVEFVHDLGHAREDARAAVAARESGKPDPARPVHDDSNCPLHAQLHLPLLAPGWVPLLVALGLFIAFLSLLPAPLVSRRSPARIDCRGPPAGSLLPVLRPIHRTA